MKFLVLTFLIFLMFSCDQRAVNDVIRRFNPQVAQLAQKQLSITETVTEIDEDELEERAPTRTPTSRRSSCGDYGTTGGSEVSMASLDYIGSRNAGKYRLYGSCSKNGTEVKVEVNNYLISLNPVCDKRRWEVFLNLTTLSAEEKTVSFKISHGKDSNIVCVDVRIAFSCPKNYIPLSPLEESRHYPNDAFCVMKYEAKFEEGKAVSKPRERPITNILHSEAVDLCRANGSRYDLMNNKQWQVLAHNIELQKENWSKGTNRLISGNILNCGVASGRIRSASKDDDDDCAETHCDQGWDYKRRTHLLPNNYVIWDLCGNAAEMMRGTNDAKSHRSYNEYNDHAYLVRSGDVRKDFGPKRNYSSLGLHSSEHRYWGLGFIDTEHNKSLIVRGQQGRHAGIFSAHLNEDHQEIYSASRAIGFRCVYSP